MRLQLKPSQRMNDNDKKEVKRSNSTTSFLKKDMKSQHQQQDSLHHQQSLKYIDGVNKNNNNVLSYNQSIQSLKSDENTSAKQSQAFKIIDQNISNNHGSTGLNFRSPSMEKELKILNSKLAIERNEIEIELTNSKNEADKWKDKYEQLKKANQFQQKSGPHKKSNASLQDNESILKSYSDLSGIQNKQYNDSSNSIFYGLSNIAKSQVSEKDVKLLAQKFAIERVGLENQIKSLQSQRSDLENQVEYNKQENQNLKYMYQELEKQKEMEIANFKRKLQDNEIDLKRNIQQEFIKLGDTFTKEKATLEKKSLILEDELDELKRENQTLVDTIHTLNIKVKSQNDFIQSLTSNKQEQGILFEKVSQLERELQYITDQLLKEQEGKQGLLDRISQEKSKCENLQQQLEDQQKNNDKLSSSSKEINNKFSELLNQLKFEQQRCEQLEYFNQKLQDTVNEQNSNPPQFGSDYKIRYEEEKKRNIDLLSQINQQRELIDSMKQQIEMFEEFSQKLTTNAQINQENNEIEKNEYQRQINYLNGALKNLQSKLALKLRILQKTYKLLLVDSHLKSKLTQTQNDLKQQQINMITLEETLALKQKELGETQGKLGISEMELNNKRKEIFDKQSQILDLQEQIRERAAGEINSYELSSLKMQIQRLQTRITEQDDDNQSLSEQNNLTEQLLNKMREQLTTKEQEFLIVQQQLNGLKLQQSKQDDLQVYQKKVEEQKKLVEQNRIKMADLFKIIEQKDKSIYDLQKDISDIQQQFDQKLKNAQLFTEEYNLTKNIETEKNELYIRNLETVYEQRVTQLQQVKTIEEENYIKMIQTKNEENKSLQQKIDDYLSKMNILSNEMEKLQVVINQKDHQIQELIQESQQQKMQQFEIHSQNASEQLKKKDFDVRHSRTQSFNFNQVGDSTFMQQNTNQSQQLLILKLEFEQTKQQLQERIKKDDQIIQELTQNLTLKSKELEIKTDEIRRMVQDQSKSLVNSFSKDSTINQKIEEIASLTRKVSQLEEEKRQLEYEKWSKLIKSEQPQGGSTEQQTISQQKDQIEELRNQIQNHQNEIQSLKDSLQSKKMSEYDMNQSISNSLQCIEGEVQVSKLKREVQQLTKLCESQESSLKFFQSDNQTLKKQLEDVQSKYDISEKNLTILKTHIVKITEDNEKLVNKIKDLSQNNSILSSRKNSTYNSSVSQQNQNDQIFENFKIEVDRQKQIYLQEITELNQKVEKCSFDKMVLSQEIEMLRDHLKQKERQLEVLKSELKMNSQTDRFKNTNSLTTCYMNENQRTIESQNNQFKSEQNVFMDVKIEY